MKIKIGNSYLNTDNVKCFYIGEKFVYETIFLFWGKFIPKYVVMADNIQLFYKEYEHNCDAVNCLDKFMEKINFEPKITMRYYND